MSFGSDHALLYRASCGHFATEPAPGNDLELVDSDSEIGDEFDACFKDFQEGFDTFPTAAPSAITRTLQ